MKLFQIKSNNFLGSVHTHASLVDGVFSVMELYPIHDGMSVPSDALTVDGVTYSVEGRSSVPLSYAQSCDAHTVLALHKHSSTGGVVNLYSQTVNGRMTMQEYSRATHPVVAHVFVPFSGGGDDIVATVPVAVNGKLTVSGDIQVQEHVFDVFESAAAMFMPSIELSGVAINGDILTANVSLLDASGQQAQKDAVIFLETTAGSLLTPRINCVSGSGTAILSLSGLPPGTQGRVKAGFRYFPGKTEINFQV